MHKTRRRPTTRRGITSRAWAVATVMVLVLGGCSSQVGTPQGSASVTTTSVVTTPPSATTGIPPTTAQPPTHKASPKPTATHSPTPKPSPHPTVAGFVHPGAFCSPHLAYGYTDRGTLMQCKTSPTDSRYRWRKA